METNPKRPKQHNSIDEILAIIDAGLADNEIMMKHYKLNFLLTDELPEIYPN